jgi:hypothetical protein
MADNTPYRVSGGLQLSGELCPLDKISGEPPAISPNTIKADGEAIQ